MKMLTITNKNAPQRGAGPAIKLAVFSAALFVFHSTSFASVKTLAGSNGMNSFPGGTWDFNNTANWTEDGYRTRGTWTSNDDVAAFEMTRSAWGSVEVTIDGSLGAVGASGLAVTNELNDWQHLTIAGDTLTLGASGVNIYSENPNSYVNFNAPVVLAAGQTWRSAKVRTLTGGGATPIRNLLSPAVGQDTPITFDGFGITDPSRTADGDPRVGFSLSGDNTFTGATTVSGGAVLTLNMSTNNLNRRIDGASPLILNGGALVMSGSSASFTQTVASVVVRSGHNHITGSNGSGNFYCNQIVREGLGGTLNVSVGWSGGVNVHCTNATDTNDSNGIIGGWLTSARQGFTGNSWSPQCGGPNGWYNNANVVVTGGGTRTGGDIAPNSLRFDISLINNLGDATVTVKSGGILVPYHTTSGGRISDGKLRSGMETGELFVHAFQPFAIDSVIEDNGDTPGVLVKSGHQPLTLTGANTYTGATYINGGTLELTGDAAMSGLCHQAGATILSVANGARLTSLPGGRVLGGNLALGSGAKLELQAVTPASPDAPAAITLENPWSKFTVTADSAAPVLIDVAFDEINGIRRNDTYPLVRWQPSSTTAGVAPEAFALTLPRHMEGELVVTGTGLDLVVTQTPGIATRIIIK